MNMRQSLADPYVFFNMDKNNKLILMVSVTVVYCAIAGHEKYIHGLWMKLKEGLKLQDMIFYRSILD